MDFYVNGQYVSVEPSQNEMLSDLLRARLKLTGTKIGCEEAECGSCTVLIDGEPVLSCTYPAQRAEGKHIITIEGLSSLAGKERLAGNGKGVNKGTEKGRLHPLQDAFISHGAVQCGFCIPGQIMTAYALLEKDPDPDPKSIRLALKDTLCRCGGYPSILNAIQAAAKSMQTGKPIASPSISTTQSAYQVVGKIQPRPDAIGKVTGSAKFTDDIQFDGMLHARVRRAGVPHAIVKHIDVQKARNLRGVVCVLTAEDIPGDHYHGLVIPDWPTMVGVNERVRYVGDAIAIVAAESREIASQAIELIQVEYEQQPVITSALQAKRPSTPNLHADGNLLKHIKVRKGNVEEGFAESDVVLEHTFHTAITEHAFIEPECSIARLVPAENSGYKVEVYVGSQIPYADRSQIARALDLPEERVRVIGMMIGGGFGGKEDIAGQIHAALLAQATGRPVKLLFDRQESMLVHPKRHATQIRVKVGAKQNGRLTSIETELFGDTGAYASLGEKVLTRATTHSAGPYEVAHARADCYAMYTNNPPAGAFRGFGVTQSCFAVESMMDMLAEELDIDAGELRRINALKVGSVTNTGQTLRESVGLLECLDGVENKIHQYLENSHEAPLAVGSKNIYASRVVVDQPHLHRAWGLAVGYKNTGLGGGAPDKALAEVELYSDGILEVRSSSAEIGQGLVTVLQMIVAEEFDLPYDQVKVLLSDTDLTPDGGPTTASRQTFVTGNAARYAAQTLRQAITTTLAEKFDCPPDQIRFKEGLAQVNGHFLPLGEVVEEMHAEGREPRTLYEYWAPETQPLGEGGDMHFAFSFAAQAAEVEVNTLTGETRVLKVIAAHDVGKAINPLGLQGQVEGGVVMGLGNALTENFIVNEGIVATDRLARYRIPSIIHTPDIISIVVENPVTEGPFGAKGVGEISSIPTTPAITNAIYNAVGVRVDRLPIDQEDVLLRITV
ncbi:MAG: molybdopterin-dependent oxidoreductase [Anaerolineales bacterium]|nr:molybdopterin-dependent oxidoreductase [Anaerolineales bacterium]